MVRGRKVNSNGERSKQLLREKAIEIFSTNGYFQTKISDIVKAANVTQPTFYLYFESKESLFNDLNNEFKLNLFNIFDVNREQLEFQKNIKNEFRTILTNIFHYFVENPNLTKIGLYQSLDAEGLKNQLVEKFECILKGEHHTLNSVEKNLFAQSLMGSIERLTVSVLLEYKTSPQRLAEDIVNIYFVNEEALALS